MNNQIEKIKKTRIYLIDIVSELSVDQLNEVPLGFNNNIIWNLGHLTATMIGVCYNRAGLKSSVDEKYITPFKPGTKPEQYFTESDVKIIKELLLSSPDLLWEDYKNNKFSNYTSWTSRYGIELSNIDNALDFLMYHEGLHSGYIMALKRLLKK